MKFNNFIILAFISIVALSCEKDLSITDTPDLNVSLEKSNFKVDEEVVFTFTGYAEIVSFYSGEVFNDYDYKDGRVIEFPDQSAILSFQSGVREGTQENQLSVLISNDFDGDTSSLESVKSSNWIDITDSLTLGDSEDFTSSGNFDISEYTEGNPIYVAFKYITRPQLENGDARIWMIENFAVKSKDSFNGSQLNFVNQNTAGFYAVDEDPINTPSRSTVTSTRLSILGNSYEDPEDPKYDPENPIYDPENPIYDPDSDVYDPSAELPEYEPYDPNNPNNDPMRETWVITKPIFTNEVDLGPDRAVGIRGIQDQKLVEYTYSYSNPGNYKAVFVGKNATKDESVSIVKEVDITIEP
ncbi:DUF5017 domain-containing protein [Membranihabitans maritimus]|uniref:DUF5017 domain-containing protein n=1 Tax=Membranihabitans maritimus TaxID=2904244 RepID=UPI001F37184A|nr:DUF5017 domain-containing protein [Membranihabitans maritimus]